MELTEKQYKKWLKLANIVTNNDYDNSHEILHGVLEKVIIKMADPNHQIDNLDNYIFRSLRNNFTNSQIKDSKEQLEDIEDHISFLEEDVLEELIYGKKDDVDIRLKVIEDVVSSLEEFDQQLYILHFLHKIPQRKIARDIQSASKDNKKPITITVVHTRLAKIRKKIQAEYEKRIK